MKLSFKKAASKVLEMNPLPLSAADIARIAIESGLIDTVGATPEATMGAQIYVDIKKNKNSDFINVGKGLFSLKKKNAIVDSPLLFIENKNELTKNKLKEILHTMDPFQFEYLVADLLQKIGYEDINVTKKSGDKGIDIVANLSIGGITSVKTVIQVKRYAPLNKINGAVITQLRGSAEVGQRGLVITTSDFTKDGVDEAQAPNKMPVSLVNGEKRIQLLIKHGVGINREEIVVFSLDDSYFQNPSSEVEGKNDTSKSRSIWPLPGGIYNFLGTLNLFLESILNGNDTRKKIISWYINNFENVKSEATTQGYINVPKNMGLISYENGFYKLTDDGKEYFNTGNIDFLYEVITKNVLAFGDIFEYIKTSYTPVGEEDIMTYLKENFDIEWTTFAQVNFRLLWLINLKKISKLNGNYSIA